MTARRVPVLATIIVVLAVALMIALGLWQLQRRAEKEALLVRFAANEHLPRIAFPTTQDQRLLFRRATASCDAVSSIQVEGGRNASGGVGWRQIARCRAGPVIQIGVGQDPLARPAWTGGSVSGYLTFAPDHRPIIAGLFDPVTKPLMLVADAPAPGLGANPGPDLSAVPNNHLAYAVQWFTFAAIAAIIYAVALRRRVIGR